MVSAVPRRILWILGLLLPLSCGEGPAPQQELATSVLIVTIDTLRADRVGCYGHDKAQTPVMDELAQRGVCFETALSTAPLTLPSHASLFSATIPPYHGVRDNGTFKVTEEVHTLAERLHDEGYQTGAFVAAFVLDSQFGIDQGFETFADVPQRYISLGAAIEERPAREVNKDALAWIDTLDPNKPFFMWAHYFEPHMPYETPPGDRDPYDAEVTEADRALGEILERLKSLNRLDDTLVIVTSDHGEGLWEHGEETHGLFVYQSVLHIPLIFAHPDLPAGRVVERPCSLIDVMPTVLEILELEGEPVPEPARSLMPAIRDEEEDEAPIYFECLSSLLSYGWAPLQGVALGNLKWIEAPRPELYDIAEDPAETKNLIESRERDAKRLEAAMRQLLQENVRPEEFGSAQRDLTDEDREKLTHLGYIQGVPVDPSQASYLDPKDGLVRIQERNRALAHYETGEFQKALDIIEKLLADEPYNALFHSHAGALLVALERYDEAIDHLKKTREYGMDTAGNSFNLAQCQIATKDPEGAAESLEHALERNPKHLSSILLLAQIRARHGDKESAKKLYNRFLELWGGDDRIVRDVENALSQLDS